MARSMNWELASRREKAGPRLRPVAPINSRPATPKQLRYLRYLARVTGTTFAHPKTSDMASVEIRRMKELPKIGQ